MAWSWSSSKISRVTAYDNSVSNPDTKYSFDGINASNEQFFARFYLDPEVISMGINRLTQSVFGFSVKPNKMTRSIKQEGVES